MRTRDMGWSFRHSSTIMNLFKCVFTLEHCICTLVGSNPFRVIPLLGELTLSREHFFRYRGRSRGRLFLETDFEESRIVAFVLVGYMY